MAEKHGISPSTVSRIAHTENGLHDLWRQARETKRQHAARRIWFKTIATHPNAILDELRTMAPASYTWLYRNDGQWLQASLAGVPAYKGATRERVNWQERDEQLSLLVQAAIDALSTTQLPGKPITLQQIYHAVPTLKKYLGKRDRLPRTRRIIQAAHHGEVSTSHNTTP